MTLPSETLATIALPGDHGIALDRPQVSTPDPAISAWKTSVLANVEVVWRGLQATGIESPGQSFDFIAAWVKARGIAPSDQFYVLGMIDEHPVALMALQKRRRFGARVLSWFPGSHVGCNAPLLDIARFTALNPEQRRALWAAMIAQLPSADVLFLRALPAEMSGYAGIFDELGTAETVETLYRAEFSSWVDCDTTQRSKSRRKHDRQQGERLLAMGEVTFSEVVDGPEAEEALDVMFRHRAVRFAQMGVADPFAPTDIRAFYQSTIKPETGIDVRLHVLRLDGAIVAVRYNIVHLNRMFCLISSMIDCPKTQNGSPGKQCLLRVMQTVFDDGMGVFDMGGGFTDEKRHWCNRQIALRHHYVPLSLRGRVVFAAHHQLHKARTRIKASKVLMGFVKSARQGFRRKPTSQAAVEKPSE